METYAAGDPSETAPPQYAQQFSYATDGNGGFNITPGGNAVALGNALESVPVAEPDGSFVAVLGGPAFSWNAGGTGTIYEQHFAADDTPMDQSPVQVSPTTSTAAWVAGAGLDQGGNLYIGWYTGDIFGADFGDGSAPHLYAQEIRPDGTTWTSPLPITPTSATQGDASWAAASISVGPDGSLLAGWTTIDPTTGNTVVQARRYDPITDTQAETNTLTPASGSGSISVTSQATTMDDSVLWEYWVTNNSSHNLGQFTISGQPQGVADDASSLGWTVNSSGTGWTAGTSGPAIGSGQTGYFTFTAPAEYVIQPTAAQASGSTAFSGSVLGPGLTGPETDTLTAGNLGGQISVVSSVTPDGNGNLIWDYEVTNNSWTNIGEFAFLDEPVDASSFNSNLGWAENEADTGWAAGPTDTLLAPSQTADFNFTTPPVAAGHIAVRAASADGAETAEANVLGPSDPPTATQTNTSTLTDGAGDSVTVVSTATTFSSYVLWQYSVTNNSGQSLGNFTIPGFTGPLTDVSDESTSLGWTPDSADLGWTAGSSGQPLASGQRATFSFTTPTGYTPAPLTADVGGGTETDTGSVLAPGPTFTETTTLIATDDNGPQVVNVVSEATVFSDHILWQYWATNASFTGDGSTTTDGYSSFAVGGAFSAVSNTFNSLGWQNNSISNWSDPYAPVQIGGEGYFSFTTPVSAVGNVQVSAVGPKLTAVGQGLGPVDNPLSLSMPGGPYVPIDATDYNGSPVTNEIPKLRDYDSPSPLPLINLSNPSLGRFTDPNLQELDININIDPAQRPLLTGTFTLTIDRPTGTGEIRMWTDQSKTQPIHSWDTFTIQNLPSKIFVEGLNPSTAVSTPTGLAAQPDNVIRLSYIATDTTSPVVWAQDSIAVEVTPVLTQFTFKQGAFVALRGPGNAIIGIQAFAAPNAQPPSGALYQATVDAHNMPPAAGSGPSLSWIQNLGWPGQAGVVNGGAGAAGGFVSNVNGNQVLVNVKNVDPITGNVITGPILDLPGNTQQPPDYASDSVWVAGSFAQITGQDNPGPGYDQTVINAILNLNAPNRNAMVKIVDNLTDIAVRFNFRDYLTWRFPAGGPQNSTILYTIGTFDWTVFFRASVNQLAFPPALNVLPAAELPHVTRTLDVNDHSAPAKLVGPPANVTGQTRP